MKSFLCVTWRIISSLAEMTSLQPSVLFKQILAQDLAKWGRKRGMKKRMELIMCPKWGTFRHHRKGIGDSSNLDYNVTHLWNDNIALPVTITQSLLCRSGVGGFLLSVFLPRALMKAVHHWWSGALHKQTYVLLSVSTPLFNTPPGIKARDSLPFFPPRMAKKTAWKHHYKEAKGKTYWTSSCSVLICSLLWQQ